ncbi:MAG: proprotein convertase P-domain-containing protein [Pseudomonadota bacterium]
MTSNRRNVVAGACLAAMAVSASPVFADDKEPDGMSAKELSAACAMLDNPKKRPYMDGLLNYLLVKCGRQNELGGAETVRHSSEKSVNRIPGTDVAVNDALVDTGASRTQNETSIARSPITGTLCSGFNDSTSGVTTGQGFTGFARSTDNGDTFTDNGAFDSNSSGDPSMIWRRADENFYLATLRNGGLGIYRSTDDCQTMNLIAQATNGGDDKELLAVDNNIGSDNYGRIYMVWTDFGLDGSIYSVYSDDGVNWSSQVRISAPGGGVQGAWPIVAPDGTFYVAWVRFGGATVDMEVARSTDGGDSYTQVTSPLVGGINPADSTATANCGRSALNGNLRYLASPQIAVTPNGDLHIVYTRDPDGANFGDTIDVYYRRSMDGGDNWLPEVRINDDSTLTDQFFPTLSAGPTGRIVITWYDRRLDETDNLFVDYYSATSEDGGATFGPNERISDVSSPIVLDPNLATCYHGDYDQQIQTESRAFIQWADDREVGGRNDPNTYLDRNTFEPDFFVTGTNPIASVCAPDDAVFDIDVGQALGFSDPVTMSSSGVPAGATGSFSVNPVAPGASTVFTVSNTAGAAAGDYTIEVSGSADSKTRAAQLMLALATATPDAAALSAPVNNATGVANSPTFSWNDAAQAATYRVEIATDPDFVNVVESGTTDTTSYTATTTLSPLTRYYWRVTADNICGAGAASTTFTFETANIICITSGDAIPDNTASGLDSTGVLSASGTLTDLDVSLNVTHTYVGDLIVTLTHEDTGSSAVIMDRPGVPATGFGCSNNDIDTIFDDEAGTPVEDVCDSNPAIGGTVIPENALSTFDGEDLSGTWTLNISDNAGIDLGNLNEWCLLPATEPVAVDSDGDGVSDDADNCTFVSNADQRDTNGDGFGNACDADLNNDCVVNVVDLGLFRQVFFSSDADADFNGDGVVNVIDLGVMRLGFFSPPGPSVEPNACTPAN